jgi:replicative DNA helicase Mcm
MDAQRSIELIHYCLTQIGVDPETGKIDIDRISTGITATQRGTVVIVKDIINELEAQLGNKAEKMIPVDDIVASAKEKNISDTKVDEVLDKLNKWGDIFYPKPGFIQKI